ncbi:MAG: hypothetical protein ACR2ND_04290 [Solirubrobacteraceae bacterium]
MEEWERLADLGDRYMYEALISRHNKRMTNIGAQDRELYLLILDALSPISFLAKVLRKYGASKERFPTDYSGPWINHLAWGVSSVVSAARLAFSGQYVGAALVARHQLERWTGFLAFNTDTQREPGDDMLSYTARVWGASPDGRMTTGATEDTQAADDVDAASDSFDDPATAEPELDHRHVITSSGDDICPASVLGALGGILHADEDAAIALRWDTVDLCDPARIPNHVFGAHALIADALRLSIIQIRNALLGVAAAAGDAKLFGTLVSLPDSLTRVDPVDSEAEEGTADGQSVAPLWTRPQWAEPERGTLCMPPPLALLPLAPDHGLRQEFLDRLARDAQIFEATLGGKRPAGRLFRDDEFVSYAFTWHRHASARSAMSALDRERRELGDDFDIDGLRGRDVPYVLTSEVAGLLSGWLTGEQSAAAAGVATSLRSAYWLWLEDDDRAMGVVRTTLEQLARLRTWRRNPAKAAKLEARAQTTPRDWLSTAGWRRLEALNRALGEMAHVRSNSRWLGARELLAKLQPAAEASSLQTARGFSLTAMAMLAADELIEVAATVSPKVAQTLDAILDWRHPADGEDERSLEGLLDRAWEHRSTPLRSSEFGGPGVDWETEAHANPN